MPPTTLANPQEVRLSPERLSYWYLRLNGFMLLENFIVHDETSAEQRTDADLIGVRFNHRRENHSLPMKDDPIIAACDTFLNFVIAEVKTGKCALNGPWTNPRRTNMQRVLRAIGLVHPSEIDLHAEAMYTRGTFSTPYCTGRLFAFGRTLDPSLPAIATPVLFDDMLRFIYKRFREYRKQKRNVVNWTPDGRLIAQHASNCRDVDRFLEAMYTNMLGE